MTTFISRDPYAREDTIRKTVPKNRRTCCAWCGSEPGRFAYSVVRDSIHPRTPYWSSGFCSIGCWKAFNT